MNYLTGFVAVAVVVALFVFVPFAMIWALNVVFPNLAIPYTIETWFAAVVLKAFFSSNITYNKKK